MHLVSRFLPRGWRRLPRVTVFALVLAPMLSAPVWAAAKAPVDPCAELKARVEAATKDLKDISATCIVTYQDKKALEKIDTSYSAFYDFKSAKLTFKQPDKLRLEGKLGMVKFEYIMNGTVKIVRAPMVRIKSKKDYAHDPAKTQTALDIGLITSSLWNNRTVEVVTDDEARANGEIKLSLRWPNNTMISTAWLDATDLYLKRFEKRDAQNNLKVRAVYSEPRRFGDVIWMPTRVDIYGPDGARAGTSELTDVKVNIGQPDSLFE